MNKIVYVENGYNFSQELEEARNSLAYYEEDILLTVTDRIIEAMDNLGISRSELARRLDVSPAYITKILRGHANLTLESLAKIAFALNLKWECMMIPKKSKIMYLSLSHESEYSLNTIETVTITGTLDSADYGTDNYQTGESYELPISA